MSISRQAKAFAAGMAGLVGALALSFAARSLLAAMLAGTAAPGRDNVQGGEMGALYAASFLLFGAACGAIFAYFQWEGWPRSTRRKASLYGSLAVVLGLSGANYINRDQLVSRGAQASVNLLLIFLCGVVVLEIIGRPALSPEGRVLRWMSLTLLIGLGIVLPAIFDVIWLLDRMEVSTTASSGLLSTVSGVAGAVIAGLDYLQNRRNSARGPA